MTQGFFIWHNVDLSAHIGCGVRHVYAEFGSKWAYVLDWASAFQDKLPVAGVARACVPDTPRAFIVRRCLKRVPRAHRTNLVKRARRYLDEL